jgi:hypothetical protein
MKIKMASKEKRSQALDVRLQLDKEKLELDRQKMKVELARSVVGSADVSSEAKEAANAFLISFFT